MSLISSKKEFVKKKIISDAQVYIDSENNFIDTKKFFSDYPKYKNVLYYYFGSISGFYEEVGAKPPYDYLKKIKQREERKKGRSVRNQLAYERYLQLRKDGMTLEDIGAKYGVSKQMISILANTLDITLN